MYMADQTCIQKPSHVYLVYHFKIFPFNKYSHLLKNDNQINNQFF